MCRYPLAEQSHPRYGKYQLLERIGIGGMAEVFKAKIFGAEGFERMIAIKRILPHLVEDADFVQMFVDEAKIAVRLNHPNIVAIDDLGKIEGTLFIAMEYVRGRDLRAIYDCENARGGTMPIGVACHVVMKMCEALHHAHFATGPRGEPLQVIHRDVSPQNVMLSFDGEVKVADFGLAKARGRMVQTQAGVVKGKLAYMSPEQLRGEDIDHRVDVFGLGIVLFELLTGQRLFLGPSDMDTLRRVYEATVPPMAELNPEVHPELEAIVRRALAKNRDDRYATALDLHDELQTYAYAHDCYAGASSLRQYLREAFPEFAPQEDMPPFAAQVSSLPAPPPVPTLRPPRHKTAQPSEEILLPPPIADSGLIEPALIEGFPLAFDDYGDEEDTTDRPPMLDFDDVVTSMPDNAVRKLPIVETGRPPAESSHVQPSERGSFPTSPPGVYQDESSTDEPYGPGPDTNPAPAPLDHTTLDDQRWDETTQFEPVGVPIHTTEDNPDEWDEELDSTVISDPRSAEGNN